MRVLGKGIISQTHCWEGTGERCTFAFTSKVRPSEKASVPIYRKALSRARDNRSARQVKGKRDLPLPRLMCISGYRLRVASGAAGPGHALSADEPFRCDRRTCVAKLGVASGMLFLAANGLALTLCSTSLERLRVPSTIFYLRESRSPSSPNPN